MRGSVVVTGASSGIGAATTRYLGRKGYRVFGTFRRPEDAASIREVGVDAVRMDVTEPESVASACQEVLARTRDGPLLGLVNNAGIPGMGPVELIPLAEFRQVLEVNVLGALAVTQAFLPALRESRGRVIMISSVSGRIPMPFAGSYAASKFALEALSDCLRRELHSLGVAVVVIQPGPIRTPIWEKVEEVDPERFAGTPYEEPVARVRAGALEAGRVGLPATQVARAVERGLSARRPPARILVVSRRGAVRIRFLQLLPDRWLDAMIARRTWR